VTDVLGGAIAHYVFISSISAYRELPPHARSTKTRRLQKATRAMERSRHAARTRSKRRCQGASRA